jgi:hypothetical protein
VFYEIQVLFCFFTRKERDYTFKESEEVCADIINDLYPDVQDTDLFDQTYDYYNLYLQYCYTDYTCLLIYLLLGSYAIYQMGSLAMEIQDVSHGSSYGSQNVCWRMINYFSIKTKRISVIVISGSLGIAAIILY